MIIHRSGKTLRGRRILQQKGSADADAAQRRQAGQAAGFDSGDMRQLETALLLGSLRRLVRPADAPKLSPIRSLAYFRPVIDELRAHPAPESYLDYLRLKLRQAAAKPAKLPNSTPTDDR